MVKNSKLHILNHRNTFNCYNILLVVIDLIYKISGGGFLRVGNSSVQDQKEGGKGGW